MQGTSLLIKRLTKYNAGKRGALGRTGSLGWGSLLASTHDHVHMLVGRHRLVRDQPAPSLIEARDSLDQIDKKGRVGLDDAIFEHHNQRLDRHAFGGKCLVDLGRRGKSFRCAVGLA